MDKGNKKHGGALKPLYGLDDISQWNENGSNETIDVPAIQRGLVWKARQMELLWDSILRGFPIGSFVVASFPEPGEQIALHLLDGQQRMNSIKLGFSGMPLEDEQLPVLWFDLCPNDKSTRKYWIKACTPAHPWGYANDDECSILKAWQKREACDAFAAKNKYRPRTSESWPIEAKLPIPLSCLVRAAFDKGLCDEISFFEKVMSLIESDPLPPGWNKGDSVETALREQQQQLFSVFSSLREYRVATAYLPEIFNTDLIDNKNEQTRQIEEVECLFDRMNTLGTRISSSDLHYSAIKAHFPPELKKENETTAENIMPPEHLVMLAFRLALSPSCSNALEVKQGLRNTLSLTQIRRIAREASDEKVRILSLFNSEEHKNSSLRDIVDQLDKWLKYGRVGSVENLQLQLPPAVVLKIVLHSPEVYLLLMWLLREDKEQNIVTSKLCLQLATIIHWFADKKSEVCNSIVKECSAERAVSLPAIRRGLFESIKNNWLRCIYPREALNDATRRKWSASWRWWDVWGNTPYWDWLVGFREQKDLLLYAQRDYLAQEFPDYDPANIGLFSESNRPWDMDHIIPQNWISGKQGPDREFCKQWLNNIGNFAAIPFEKNRSKSDSAEWSEYENKENANGLLFDDSFSAIDEELVYSKEINGKKMAHCFADAVLERMMKIYSAWYDGLSISEWLGIEEGDLPEKIAKRRKLFLDIQEALGDGAECYFVHGSREYPLKEYGDIHFCTDWLSVGLKVEKYLVCLTSNAHKYEIGIRKAPEVDGIDRNLKSELMVKLAEDRQEYSYDNSGWWHLVRSTDKTPNVDMVVEELKVLRSSLCSMSG